jgi:hypothetical protein
MTGTTRLFVCPAAALLFPPLGVDEDEDDDDEGDLDDALCWLTSAGTIVSMVLSTTRKA